ncbi:MAG: bifunctional adenosylcobinamide kinase/adenosylcobinamide-phosphate guanylyltransferase [Lachnospiraceae bacterium]|nr:bifunctional adenosylcobinamide kinase/adenosylcobinamide-phosphate guanylyltransferase [Lachnospiraceae bacterium]
MTDRRRDYNKAREGTLVLVTGGASSGKSAFAESLAADMAEKEMASLNGGRLFYAATMRPDADDAETCARIERHRRMRRGKGFETIEMERGIAALGKMLRSGDTVILEDLPNLLANEMFPAWDDAEGSFSLPETVADLHEFLRERIIDPLFEIKKMGVNIVAVGSRVAEDLQHGYEEETLKYIEGLTYIERETGAEADRVWEVVCGIAVAAGGGGDNAEEGTFLH